VENGVSFPDGVQGTSGQAGNFTGLGGADPVDVLERIPSDWTAEPAKGEGGVTFRHPTDWKYNSVRIMPGDPGSPFPNSQGPYMKIIINGSHVDANGIKVDGNSADAHIPLRRN
jgi:hypothetical protein